MSWAQHASRDWLFRCSTHLRPWTQPAWQNFRFSTRIHMKATGIQNVMYLCPSTLVVSCWRICGSERKTWWGREQEETRFNSLLRDSNITADNHYNTGASHMAQPRTHSPRQRQKLGTHTPQVLHRTICKVTVERVCSSSTNPSSSSLTATTKHDRLHKYQFSSQD